MTTASELQQQIERLQQMQSRLLAAEAEREALVAALGEVDDFAALGEVDDWPVGTLLVVEKRFTGSPTLYTFAAIKTREGFGWSVTGQKGYAGCSFNQLRLFFARDAAALRVWQVTEMEEVSS